LLETGSCAVASSDAVIEVDAIVADAQAAQRVALGCKVLLIGRAAGVADQDTAARRVRSHHDSGRRRLVTADLTKY
jgi:hypothetical protein